MCVCVCDCVRAGARVVHMYLDDYMCSAYISFSCHSHTHTSAQTHHSRTHTHTHKHFVSKLACVYMYKHAWRNNDTAKNLRDHDFLLSSILADISTSPLRVYCVCACMCVCVLWRRAREKKGESKSARAPERANKRAREIVRVFLYRSCARANKRAIDSAITIYRAIDSAMTICER